MVDIGPIWAGGCGMGWGGEAVRGLQRFKRLEKATNLLSLCINQPTPEWNISETEI